MAAVVADFMEVEAVASTVAEVASMVAPRMAADIIVMAVDAHTEVTAATTVDTADIMDGVATTDVAGTAGAGGMADMAGMEVVVGTVAGATHIGDGVGASDGVGLITRIGAIRMATIGDTRPIIRITRTGRRMTIRAANRTRIRILIPARQDISASRTGTGILRQRIRRPIPPRIQDPTQIQA